MHSTNTHVPPLPASGTCLAITKHAMRHPDATKVTSNTNTQKPWSLKNLVDYASFTQHFIWRKQLGDGGDGAVSEYFWKTSWKDAVAAKVPKGSHGSKMRMMSEIKLLMTIGQHDNINGMLAYCGNFEPASPAVFFQVCDLGDVHSYTEKWFAQQRQTKSKNLRLHEVTVLKLMRDVASALDFLHNGHDGICFVHNDLKPENILVLTPPDHEGKGIPTEPIFKITDFARYTTYPTLPKDKPGKYSGTPEFAPPLAERDGLPKPSVDMWGLGATIQCFALNTLPIQSKEAFVRPRTQMGKTFPNSKDEWNSEKWRNLIPVTYRPLNVMRTDLQKDWDLADCWSSHHPYSTALNNWYCKLFDNNPVTRITSAHFAKYVLPSLEKQMLIAKELALAQSSFDQMRLLREQAQVQEAGELALRMQAVD
jgi:serine/threonine protein kinase